MVPEALLQVQHVLDVGPQQDVDDLEPPLLLGGVRVLVYAGVEIEQVAGKIVATSAGIDEAEVDAEHLGLQEVGGEQLGGGSVAPDQLFTQ